jgi:hypothetical protein
MKWRKIRFVMRAKEKELRVLDDDVVHKVGRNRDDEQKDEL